MKKIFFIAGFFISPILTQVQDSFKIYHNNKLVFSSSVNEAGENIVVIKKTDLEKSSNLKLVYKETEPNKDWKRSFSFADSVYDPTRAKDGTISIIFPNTKLKKIFDRSGKIAIFTWALPTDPNLAASIRIRRVHLCTLQLQ